MDDLPQRSLHLSRWDRPSPTELCMDVQAQCLGSHLRGPEVQVPTKQQLHREGPHSVLVQQPE